MKDPTKSMKDPFFEELENLDFYKYERSKQKIKKSMKDPTKSMKYPFYNKKKYERSFFFKLKNPIFL